MLFTEDFLAILFKILKNWPRKAAFDGGSSSKRLNKETVMLKQVYSICKYEKRGKNNYIFWKDLHK